jgi:outer membrane protein assembly factor BamD (BamD/ComL family)
MQMNARLTAAIVCASIFVAFGSLSGCRSMRQPEWMRSAGMKGRGLLNDDNDIKLTASERAKRLAEAKKHYLEADKIYRAASSGPRDQSRKQFLAAAKLFGKAVKAHPRSAIAQDAQFMEAESYFFADHLSKAEKSYGILQKEFPNSRHNDRAAARQFAIAQYWIETEKAGGSKIMPVNFVDKKRPWFDIDGHGIRVLDQIRFDDPTGKLADDATMAAAVEHFRQGRYSDADEFLTDLRETFSDSEHLFNAHLLGIRCKMEMYAGPRYSRLVLDEAATLIQQTRTRFPDRVGEPEHREMIARAAAEVDFRKAERLAVRAEYRERRSEYGAARQYYQVLLEQHEKTPFAETARTRMAAISEYPALPERRLAWLTKIFPEGERAKPLKTTESTSIFR